MHAYTVVRKEHPLTKEHPNPSFGPIYLYRVNVHSNEFPPWNKLRVELRSTASSIINTSPKVNTTRHLCVDGLSNAVHTTSYTMLMVTWYRSECCVSSGLNFKVAGCSVVHHYLSKHLLQEHRVAVNMT